MANEDVWLDDREQQLWRRWLRLASELPHQLHRELQADAGISWQDFEVLVQLTEAPEHRLRISELAAALVWEKSRTSHHLTRMQSRGLVAREECDDDARGAFVVVTPAGRRVIETAAPGHARAVRRLLFDALSPADTARLNAILGRVLDGLDEPAGQS
ncbi:MAG: MarR family transcriptional regulator [Nocardioidaceae bacterium]